MNQDRVTRYQIRSRAYKHPIFNSIYSVYIYLGVTLCLITTEMQMVGK